MPASAKIVGLLGAESLCTVGAVVAASISCIRGGRVAEWQTHATQNRAKKFMRVRLPPRPPLVQDASRLRVGAREIS